MVASIADVSAAANVPALTNLAITDFTATPLTNGSVALNWTPLKNVRTYQVYSDMGSGFGVYIHKAQATQATFIDRQLRFGTNYNYRLVQQENQRPVVLAQVAASTFAKTTEAANPVPSQLEVTTAGIVAAPTALPADAVLLGLVSDNNYTDEFNTLTIVGEVRNDSNVDVGQTDITVTFYNAAGTIINTASGATMLKTIPPGEKSPFIITLTRPAGLASHSLRAVARPVTPQTGAQLAAANLKRFEDDAGFFHVTGSIQNVGSTTAKRIKVAAIIYNRDNRVINVGFTYSNPPKLAPGQLATYDVSFDYYPRYYTQQVIAFEE